MRLRRPHLGAALLVLSLGAVQAAPGDPPAAGEDTGEAALGGSTTAKVSPQEMSARAAQLLKEMEEAQSRLTELQISARSSRDVIKLNCVNDKLLQVKQLLNIADDARANIEAGTDRDFAYSQVTLSSEKIAGLRSEAETCAGEKEIYVGATKVSVSTPPLLDNPTLTDPFTLTSIELERPTYATPFL